MIAPLAICEKLRATEKRKTGFATNRTAPIIESEYDAAINPDGPEAADTIEALYEAGAEMVALGWFVGKQVAAAEKKLERALARARGEHD